MMISNKQRQLGVSHSKACHDLRKKIMFQLIKECGRDTCFRCSKKIENIEELSIDHKVFWMDSENPYNNFFDLENIAFSHLNCNVYYRRTCLTVKSKTGFKGVHFKRNRKSPNKYEARIHNRGKAISLGFFLTALEAAKVYDRAAEDMQLDRAVTNKMLGLI